jgi:tight adherence protein B
VRRETGGVRERVHRYGLPGGAAGAVAPLPADDEPESARRSRRSVAHASLAESLDIARLGVSPGLYLGIWIGGGLVLSLFAVAVSGTLLLLPVAAGGTFLAGRAHLSSKVERQRALFADQLADGLQTVASAMRTGHSFAGGLASLVEEAPEPTATEFGRVIADERIGVPLEQAFEQTIRRMENRDLEQVALVAVLQRETGGNGAEALDRVVDNLRGREEVRRLVRTLTAQGRLSRWVLTLLPVFLLVALSFLGDGYARPLFDTTIGNVLLVFGVGLVVAGSLVIKRLIQIRV